ncbi:hypothetical protein [Acidiphilium rubrum]|uniref:hypothetical protein n=1 Tax=Acidiphilium rubrum TaxID=526 RepID=UPI002CE39806|nr:hypothetical protein [Acidiphilium rubrum]HQT86530.1 hypothetical protein [Acidiphilium rubrum]
MSTTTDTPHPPIRKFPEHPRKPTLTVRPKSQTRCIFRRLASIEAKLMRQIGERN